MSDPLIPNSGRRVPELDGLRGIAILLVLVWHYLTNQLAPEHFPIMGLLMRTPLSVTWSGVDLFFVLSGFLIGGILIDQRESASFFRTFYVRRACRIVPLYYALIGAFLLTVAFGLTADGRLDWLFRKLHPLWTYATFTQSFAICQTGTLGGSWFGVTWSLAIEEQFYLVLPAVVYFCSRLHLPFLLAALICLAPVLRVFLLLVWPQYSPLSYILMPCRADSLLAGVLAAWALRVPAITANLRSNAGRLYWVGGALLAGVLLIGYSQQPFASNFMSLFGYTWMAVFYVTVLIMGVVEPRGPVSWVCRWAALRKLGIIAYGVYLLHQPMSGLCHGLLDGGEPWITGLRSAGITLLALAFTILLALLSYRLFEKPMIDFGHRFRYAPPDPDRRERRERGESGSATPGA